MEILDVVFRIVHIGTVIALIGGSVFTAFVLLPSAKELDEPQHQKLAESVKRRWKRFVHPGIALVLISGFYNYIRAIPNHKGDGLYHGLLGTKMLLAFVVFFIAAALVGRSPKLEPMRQSRGKWLKILIGLAVVIVTLSGYLKVRG